MVGNLLLVGKNRSYMPLSTNIYVTYALNLPNFDNHRSTTCDLQSNIEINRPPVSCM